MIDSADEARKRASLANAALRLVNDVAAAPLIAAADRGEASVQIEIAPVDIPVAARLTGRLYDNVLIEALERAGEATLARACRILVGLGFAVATTPGVEREQDIDRVGDLVRRIRISQLELGFATAQDSSRSSPSPLLQGVVLPAAHLWRSRAEAARIVLQYERKALATVAEQAERGADGCRLAWREFASGQLNAEHMQRLAEALRQRGFKVEAIDAGSTLRVNW